MNSQKLIKLGVSRCLMGERVRYDGATKYSDVCHKELASQFSLVSVCPEVEAGCSVPRPPVELIKFDREVRAVGRDNRAIDVTEKLNVFIRQKLPTLKTLDGFVLTTRSPSCGFESVTVRSSEGQVIELNSSGLFARALVKDFPNMPVIEEVSLQETHELRVYQVRVMVHHLYRTSRAFYLDRLWNTLLQKNESKGVMEEGRGIYFINNRLKQLEFQQLDRLFKTLRGLINE